jgi:hypothetical protein
MARMHNITLFKGMHSLFTHIPLMMYLLFSTVCCCAVQALHARALAIRHPLTQQPMKFVAPLHADFEAALQVLSLSLPAGV